MSPLVLPGALARCVELFSFAKSYQLGGFRLGFALGNEQAIAALEAVKVRLRLYSLPSSAVRWVDCMVWYGLKWGIVLEYAVANGAWWALHVHCTSKFRG